MSELPLPHAYDEVVSFFASRPDTEAIAAFRLSPAATEQTSKLLSKQSAGTLTSDEADELDLCIHLDQLVTLIRSCVCQ